MKILGIRKIEKHNKMIKLQAYARLLLI